MNALLYPSGKPNLNPGIQIVNSILGYCDEIPPIYGRIRKIICSIFQISPYLVLDKDQKYKYSIIYISPFVERIASQATFVLMAEIHPTEEQLKEIAEAKTLSAASSKSLTQNTVDAVKQSNVYAIQILSGGQKSLLFYEIGLNRIEQDVPIVGFPREFFCTLLKIPKPISNSLTFYGWDDPTIPDSKGSLCGIEAAQIASKEVSSFAEYQEKVQKHAQKIKEALTFNMMAQMLHYETFPKRTDAMVASLVGASSKHKKDQLKGKVFFIAGLSHLEEGPEAQSNPKLKLNALYKLIKTLPLIIIYPSIIDDNFKALRKELTGCSKKS